MGKPHAQSADEKEVEHNREQRLEQAISPLGTPILAGGGTISAAIALSATDGFEGLVAVIVGFGVIMIMSYFFFLSGDAIEKKIGKSGLVALTKIMGLILLTIGVQIFLGGLDGVLNEYLPTIPALLSGSGS
jgi:multiple antibiotic resistance protein